MKTKSYEVVVTHVQYSQGKLVVTANSEKEAREKVQELWDDGDIETDPVDGEFEIASINAV